MVKRLETNCEKDVLEVVDLFFNGNRSIEQTNKFLSNDNNYILVYKVEDKIVGFTYGYELQRFDNTKNMMYMHQIEVLKEYRKQGIGKKLMNEFIKLCKDNDCGRLFLITNKSLKPAVTLYESTGAKYINNDDIIYTYNL